MNEIRAAATIPATARPARLYIRGKSAVGTRGSGGSPYTSGSSRSRKTDPVPPTPSSSLAPYRRASVPPRARNAAPPPLGVQLGHPLLGHGDHLLVVTELDRGGRARLRAGRGLVVDQPVVAERAL